MLLFELTLHNDPIWYQLQTLDGLHLNLEYSGLQRSDYKVSRCKTRPNHQPSTTMLYELKLFFFFAKPYCSAVLVVYSDAAV